MNRAAETLASDIVQIERHSGVATVYLNRPESRNALNRELVTTLRQAVLSVSRDDSVRVIALRGRGKSFCAGADLKEAKSTEYREHHAWTKELGSLMDAVKTAAVPVIAGVHGHAIGAGCTLAMVCDYFVLSRDTSLGFPELRHGLTPGMTFPQLRRLAGPRRAMDLILSGASISADEAVAWGIASEAVETEDLDQKVADLADRIAGYDPEPVRAIKRLARAVDSMPPAAAEAAGADAVIIRRLHTQQGAAV